MRPALIQITDSHLPVAAAADYDSGRRRSYITKTRDKAAALAFMRKALKRHGSPEAITTDGLDSYKAAMKVLGNSDRQEVGRWAKIVPRTAACPSDDASARCSGSDG